MSVHPNEIGIHLNSRETFAKRVVGLPIISQLERLWDLANIMTTRPIQDCLDVHRMENIEYIPK